MPSEELLHRSESMGDGLREHGVIRVSRTKGEIFMIKILLIIAIVLVSLFILSLIVYFFNLDMKLTSAIQPLLAKHYDKIKRDRKI